MKKYLIQLIGENIDIEDLSDGLRASKWKIIKDSESYYLTSEILNSKSETNEIMSTAKEFIDIINGSAKVIHRNHKRVTTGSLTTIDENGNKSVDVFISASIESRSRLRATLTLVNDENIENRPTTIENWIDKAFLHKPIRDALYFFNELTWWNLYKIYEIIKFDVGGGNKIYKYQEKNKIKHFTQTSQSREAIGDSARHATEIYKAPKKPLTLNEAHTIIRILFENWINNAN
jgi:hypothetical protein